MEEEEDDLLNVAYMVNPYDPKGSKFFLELVKTNWVLKGDTWRFIETPDEDAQDNVSREE